MQTAWNVLTRSPETGPEDCLTPLPTPGYIRASVKVTDFTQG